MTNRQSRLYMRVIAWSKRGRWYRPNSSGDALALANINAQRFVQRRRRARRWVYRVALFWRRKC